ncbi:TolC family protein [Runella salmonicolor]|uniref:TolC family protein n=1 Tax=Runella salmonicolor TaxID=2950278 RepID=A0ABT1FJ91_9BACT|nr:TolC family protein [Runella salmonicolor]MCP1381833.1 TolC family protein [Runella salmonicolor]
MQSIQRKWKWLVLCLLPLFPTYSQTRYSLQEAIQYGVTHNINVKNSQTDAQSAESRIGEIRSVGLPQVNASVSLMDNLIIQRVFLPAIFFDPQAPEGAPPVPVQFGVKYSGNAGLQLNQMIFNAQWLLGLKAAQAYRELAVKNVTQSKIQIAESVSKAYYGVLVAEERAKLLDLNIQRLDSLTREMGEMNKKGFVEKLDVDRLEVSLNNLKTERSKVQNMVDLSYYMLKFQMGMKLDEAIQLTDRINETDVEKIAAEVKASDVNDFKYDQRVDYSILKSNLLLSEMDVENNKRGYYPTVSAFAGYGYNTGRNGFGEVWGSPWFNNANIGLSVNIPVFDGFAKKYKIQQAKFTVDKVKQSLSLVEQSIDLQIRSANITIINGLETLKTQKRNLDLAQEVVRVSKIKYQSGTGSNIEVINAESALKEAQTNYFASLYELLLSKVDLDKAKGKLNY